MSASAEEVIELEPTIEYPRMPSAPRGQAARESAHVALVTGSEPSLNTELAGLLRRRLFLAAAFLAVAYTLYFLAHLMFWESLSATTLVFMGVRAALCMATAGLLASSVPLTAQRLRLVEYCFFGVMTLMVVFFQYFVNRALMERGDVPRMVAFEKNGIINMCILMFLYGVFIPNDPKTTARVVLLMALGPLLVLSVLVERFAERTQILDHLASEQLAVSNGLFLATGAALAIYSAYVLHGLRGELREAKRFGQYQLREKLGEGGMGEVYFAEHQLLKRPCALKLIRPESTGNPLAQARFEREVQSAAKLSHPNVIEIYDYGHTDDGTFYYVMEYLSGLNLGELVEQFGPLPPGRAIYLARQACGALAEAHGLGLIHRDLKPANLFVAIRGGEFDVAKVLDFGLVKVTGDPSATHLTQEQTVSGTPSYMAPEQAMGRADMDARADQYALGALLYFMVTGRSPFSGRTPMEIMIAVTRDPVEPPSTHRPDLPDDLEQVILRCLAKEPGERFEDVRALSRALAACRSASEWGPDQAEAWWIAQAERASAAATAS